MKKRDVLSVEVVSVSVCYLVFTQFRFLKLTLMTRKKDRTSIINTFYININFHVSLLFLCFVLFYFDPGEPVRAQMKCLQKGAAAVKIVSVFFLFPFPLLFHSSHDQFLLAFKDLFDNGY